VRLGLTQTFAIGLGCDITHASKLIYSDNINLEYPNAATPVGLNCRLCERAGCSRRALPPLRRNLILDENTKSTSPFIFHSKG